MTRTHRIARTLTLSKARERQESTALRKVKCACATCGYEEDLYAFQLKFPEGHRWYWCERCRSHTKFVEVK